MTGSGLWQNPLQLNTANPVPLYEDNITIPGTVGQFTTLTPVSSVTSPNAGYAIANGLGYEISLTGINHGAGDAANFYQVIITFYDDDSASAVPVDQVMWWCPLGVQGSGNPCIVVGHGPLRGLFMKVQVSPSSGATNVDIGCRIRGVGRTYLRDDWREQWPIQNVPSYTRPNNDQISCSNAGTENAPLTANAGATIKRLLPLYSGWMQLRYGVNGLTTNQMGYHLYPQNILGNAGSEFNPISDIFLGASATSLEQGSAYFPRDMIVIHIQNNSSSNGTVYATFWPQEY